ncbi:MAG: hypothetical protein IIC82_06515 [Chloroflexi bacterium]|nr:hypothetical protein [Chloroflexota bacterium]
MPNRPELSILLFDGPTSSTVLEDLTSWVGGLRFSTSLHGGFRNCDLTLGLDLGRAWTSWLTDRFLFRLAIYEGVRLVWEGRKEDVTLTERGIKVRFNGYWANLGDFPHLDYAGNPPTRVTYNSSEHADDVFKDVLAKLPATQIDADVSNIARPDLVVADATDPLTFAKNETGQEVAMTVAGWSDSSSEPWHAAIWDDRKPYLQKRDLTAVTWHTLLAQLKEGWQFHLSFGAYHSDLYADYLSGGNSVLTSLAFDQLSRDIYGRRAKALRISREVPVAAAENARDAALTDLKRPRQFGAFALQGVVLDADRAPTPLWRVRAGDVIRIDDLVPASADLDAVTLDGLRTFHIVETDYDHRSNTLRLQPDLSQRTLARVLQRAGIRD